MQRLLLTLLACFYSASLYAQLNVDVDIEGISDELANNVRLLLSIEQHRSNPLLSEGRLFRLHNKAPAEISKALQPFGYYRPQIKSELSQPEPEQWQAIYTIDPGPALPIGVFNFTLSGEIKDDPEFQTLIQAPPLQPGATFNHLQYEKFKGDLAKLAAERGYFDAHFSKHRVEIDLKAYQARIDLSYDGGVRYRFGDVALAQDVLEPELLQRYLTFQQGEPYTLNKLLELQQALNDSDYFQTVEVSPGEPDNSNGEVPVSVALTPRKKNRYNFGIGYGTDTGARTKFGWEIPRVNAKGHRFSSEVKLSEIGYSLSLNYRVPVLNPRTDQIVYSAGVINEKTDTSESTVRTVGSSLNRGRGAWRESLALNYQQETYEIAGVRDRSILLIPGGQWSRTWGRDFINTIDGLRFDIGLRGASEHMVSDTDFAQLQGGVKFITPLGSRDRMIARGRIGSTWTDAFEQLPSSVRFFAGGSQSVRGYSYQSLGPKNDQGDVVGGKHLMIGSIEFEHMLNGKWGVAAFYDGGNAIDSFADELERGAGLGLRWHSPVGPVRIDIANAVSREGNHWRLHINIGPDL